MCVNSGRLARAVLLLACAAAAVASPAAAQLGDNPSGIVEPDKPKPEQGPRVLRLPGELSAKGLVVTAQAGAHSFLDPADSSRRVVVFLGGVVAEQAVRTVRADTLVVILSTARAPRGAAPEAAPQGPTGASFFANQNVLEVYADGNVSVEEGEERLAGASAFLLDNVTGVATVANGELFTMARGEPLVIRYDRLRRLQDGTAQVTNLRATNCTFGHPHWHIEVPEATLTPTPDGRILDTSSNIVRLGEVPVLWWPGMSYNIDRDHLLLRHVNVGSRSRFGTTVQTGWEGDASGFATNVARWFGGNDRVDAAWGLDANWYSKRGFFFEPSIRYRTPDGSKGELLGAYIDDQADEDHLGQPIDDSQRGRIKLQHRTRIDERQTVDVEVARQSDRNFLNEYYEEEFKEGKPQETYVSYRDVVENHAFTALASTRLNDFDTQVEYQPALTWRRSGDAVGKVLIGDAFLTTKDFISNARLLPDDDTDDPSVRNLRAGLSAQLDWPLDLPNGDRINVTAQGDLTGFEDTVDEGTEARYATVGGVKWSRTYSGTGEAQSETWNLDGLRRIVEPFVGYFNRFALSMEPDELLQIDAIEQEDRVETLTLGVRDRIQTHQDGKVVTIMDNEFSLPLYPKADRDNDGDTVGALQIDTRYQPHARLPVFDDMRLHWRAAFDPNRNHYESSYANFSTGFGQGRRLRLSQSAVYHEFNFLTLGVEWMLNGKWTVAAFYQEDARTNERVKHGFLLRQKAHCWFIDYEIAQRRGESSTGEDKDEVRVSVNFQPVIFDADQDLTDSIGGRYP